MEKEKHPLTPDSSQYFTQWGSRNPLLTLTEELDNILAAKPNIAGINFVENFADGTCTMQSYNDGIIPSHTRTRDMYKTGKSMSDGRGVSLCGVGQIEALVAGRKSSKSTSTLIVKVRNNGETSVFTCTANGFKSTIDCEYEGPFKSGGTNLIEKTYSGLKSLSKDELTEFELITAIKIFYYCIENPKFKFYFNGNVINPIDLFYGNIDDDRIERFSKDYTVNYHGSELTIRVTLVDVARYVKPNGYEVVNGNKYDFHYKLSEETSGMYIVYDNDLVVYGGIETWKLFDDKHHSTHSGQRILISLPHNDDLKEEIFGESPDKHNVKIKLSDIFDYNGNPIFSEILSDIKCYINLWTKQRTKIDEDGEKVDTETEKLIYKSTVSDEHVIDLVRQLHAYLSKEQYFIFSRKKVNTIFKDTGCTNNNVVQCTLDV